jgi:predicted AlkP superfamily pyrophosphatase or phosphodiesterase
VRAAGLSRPLYECILTGVPPIDSGIVHNNVARLSSQRSIYHYARDAGLKTAAAAYHWVSELYNRYRSYLRPGSSHR